MTEEQRAHAFGSIRETNGWSAVLEIIEDIKRDTYEEWQKMPADKMTSKQAFNLKARFNSFNELTNRLEDLELVLKHNSKQR